MNDVQKKWMELSTTRQQDMQVLLAETVDKFQKKGELEFGKIYPIEFTKGFDHEEPKQYVYMICNVSMIENPEFKNLPEHLMQKIQENKPKMGLQLNIDTIEIYTPDTIDAWLEHNDRIKSEKNQTVFHENTLTDDQGGKHQSAIHPVKENKELEQRFGMIKDHLVKENGAINKTDLFTFYNEEVPQLTEREYLVNYHNLALRTLNGCMFEYLNMDDIDPASIIHNMTINLRLLQQSFSTCDFYALSKAALMEIGFMNWMDRLLLIPHWAFPVILRQYGIRLEDQKGTSYTFTEGFDLKTINFTTSYGCVPYGLIIKDLKQDTLS